jgi:PAS domain S-box-containing protein
MFPGGSQLARFPDACRLWRKSPPRTQFVRGSPRASDRSIQLMNPDPQDNSGPGDRAPRRQLLPHVLPWVVLACTLLSTVTVAYYVWSKDRMRADHVAAEAAREARDRLQGRLDGYVSVLRGAAGLVAPLLRSGAGDIPARRADFAHYVERLELSEQHPGIQGIGFSLRLSAADREHIERRMRAVGADDFRVWTDQAVPDDRDELHSIVFLEPLDERNRAAIGFDMFSEPVRREAMARARDTGRSAASGVVSLKQEIGADRQPGFLIYLPVYHTGRAPQTVEERRVELAGFVYAPFRAGDLLDGVFGRNGDLPTDVSVYDGAGPTPALLDRTDDGSAVPADRDTAPAGVRRDVSVAGRTWALRLRPRPQPELSLRPALVPLIVVGGSGLAALLFLITRAQGRAGLAAEDAAAELRRSQDALERANASLRQSEARLRALTDSNIVGMMIGDVRGRIHEANDAFLRLLGYGRQDLLNGTLDWKRLTAPPFLPQVEAAMEEIQRLGRNEPYEKEFVRRDGTRVPVLVGKAYLEGEDGRFVGFVLDLTVRKRAEEALRASEDQVRLITDSLPVLISYLDADQRYRFNNQLYEQWFGKPRESIYGRTAREVIGEAAYAHRRPYLEAALAGQTVRFDGPTPHSDDTVRDSEITYVPDVGPDRRVRGLVVLAADVTEQRRAAQALRRYADLFQHAELGLVMTGTDGVTLELANPAFARMYGLDAGALAGRSILDVFAPEYRTEVPSHVRIAAERGHHTFESVHERADGSRFPVELDVTAVKGPDGAVTYHILSVTDITEREQAEAELRDSEARKGAILETALDAIVTVDHEGRVLEFNPAAERMFGHDRDEAVGRRVAELIVPATLREGREAGLTRYLRTGHAPTIGRRVETTAVRADGEEFPVELGVARIGGEGEPVFTAHIRDITGRKRDELERERLLSAERDARAQAEASKAEAERSARAAEAANRSKDEFLATLSHELRTPLNAILGWAQLLRMGNLEPGEAAQGVETIERNARAQAQLVEDLLDLSRIISGKLRLELGAVDLPAVIEAALDAVRPAAEAKGIRLIPVIDSHAGAIRGDANRLLQVVWNLLSNAIKFTPRDGQVQVCLANDGGQAEISVTDTGQGIRPEFLAHAFDRLRQADASTTRKHGGLGLGLSIVRHLVELHGGTVAADSPGEGLGATFTVRLPVAAPAQDAAPAAGPADAPDETSPQPLPSLRGVRALVVDDEPDARDLIGRILGRCGADVSVAASAREAVEALPHVRPDVLLSDIGMPEEDGYSLIRRIRALPVESGGGTPAIALTAFARSDDRARALDAGFHRHVTKPVEPAELAQAVAELLHGPGGNGDDGTDAGNTAQS